MRLFAEAADVNEERADLLFREFLAERGHPVFPVRDGGDEALVALLFFPKLFVREIGCAKHVAQACLAAPVLAVTSGARLVEERFRPGQLLRRD